MVHFVQWQGIYIIPLHVEMLDYCHAPTPYLIGVHSSIYTRLLEEVGTSIADDDISIFDIDSKAPTGSFFLVLIPSLIKQVDEPIETGLL